MLATKELCIKRATIITFKISFIHNRKRRNAVFAPNLWNVRQRTQDGLPRTNNKLEGWHRAIQTLLDGPHPSIWSFFSAIQKEEGLQDADLTALMAGQEIQKQKKKYKDVNDRLKIIIENYDNDAMPPFQFSPTLLPPSSRTVLSLSCLKVSQCINGRDLHCKS